MLGENNWDHFCEYRLTPTIYYTVSATETHYFISYHIFHPRDWSNIRLGVHLTHENDGENLQVVVSRMTGQVQLLYTQAHYHGKIHVRDGMDIQRNTLDSGQDLVLYTRDGKRSRKGTHVGVFVESGGHEIYNLKDPAVTVTKKRNGYLFDGNSGILLRPARENEPVNEPETSRIGQYPYQLESTVQQFWKNRQTLFGEGRLFDGTVDYTFEKQEYPFLVSTNRIGSVGQWDRIVASHHSRWISIFQKGYLGASGLNPPVDIRNY